MKSTYLKGKDCSNCKDMLSPACFEPCKSCIISGICFNWNEDTECTTRISSFFMLFITDNMIRFFGKDVVVLNFHKKAYLNPQATKKYKQNRRILKSGKLSDEFGKWMYNKVIDEDITVFVILGRMEKLDEIELIKLAKNFPTFTFLHYDIRFPIKKVPDNLVWVRIKGNRTNGLNFRHTFHTYTNIVMDCPKFKNMYNTCSKCKLCLNNRVKLPKKVVSYLL